MKDYSISVVMATYNGAAYIREQLDSILAQTLTFSELIISDDGSTDGTIEIIQQYCLKDNRIKLVFNKGRHDIKSNFVNGFKYAAYELIAPTDQDDIWYPNKLETLVGHFNDNVDVVNAQDMILYEDNTEEPDIWYLPDISETIYRNKLKGHTCMFKRKLIDLYQFSGDCSWDYVLAFYCCVTNRYKTISDILMTWRRHREAVTYGSFHKKNTNDKTQTTILDKPLKKWDVVRYVNNALLNGNTHPTLTKYYKSRYDIIYQLLNNVNVKDLYIIRCFMNVLLYASRQGIWSMFLSGIWSMIGHSKLNIEKKVGFRVKIANLLWAFREPYYQWYQNRNEKFLG